MLTRPVGPLRKVRITDDLSLVHVVQLVNHHQKLHRYAHGTFVRLHRLPCRRGAATVCRRRSVRKASRVHAAQTRPSSTGTVTCVALDLTRSPAASHATPRLPPRLPPHRGCCKACVSDSLYSSNGSCSDGSCSDGKITEEPQRVRARAAAASAARARCASGSEPRVVARFVKPHVTCRSPSGPCALVTKRALSKVVEARDFI